MKSIALLCLFALAACGSKAPETSSDASPLNAAAGNPSPAIDPARVFVATENFAVADVIRAANQRLRAGRPLTTAEMERCWQTETGRLAARHACALAWAPGTEESPMLQHAIHNVALDPQPSKRPLALVCLRHASCPAQLAREELSGLLSLLGPSDPTWLYALGWLEQSTAGNMGPPQPIWANLLNRPLDDHPYSLRLAYEFGAKFMGDVRFDLSARYCPAGGAGFAISRCWRFLSATREVSVPKGDAAALAPAALDSGWTLFERSFPVRAQQLKKLR